MRLRSLRFSSALALALASAPVAAGPAALVATGTVEPAPFELTLPAKVGLLEAGEERALGFEVSGRLAHLAAEGASVAAGEEIALLDASLEEAQLRQAEALLREARSELNRARGLREQHAASEKFFESAGIALELRMAERDAARERVRRRRILAPFAGVVAKTHPEPGEIVPAGTDVLELIDTSTLRLEVGIPGYQIGKVAREARVHVDVPAAPAEPMIGAVHRVAPAATPGQHLFEVEIRIPNPGGQLRPGMSARARIVTEQLDSSIVVPLASAVELGGERVVFFVEDGHAHAVSVAAAPMVGDRLVLPGDLPYRSLVLRGQHHLRDGVSVRIDQSVLEPIPEGAAGGAPGVAADGARETP
jgi:membrane fusion protein (multidrug efflux system)